VGDKAQVLLKSPFEGKILLTVERGDLLEYHYLDTKEKAASISIPIGDNFLPNVYITATAIRKMTGNQLPLTGRTRIRSINCNQKRIQKLQWRLIR
jgi:uncharacterized protein YfaS (alpha-2-macroglobulin family)